MNKLKIVFVMMIAAALFTTSIQAAVLDGLYGDLAYVNTSGVGYWWAFDGTQTIVDTNQFAFGDRTSVEAGDIDGDGLVDFITGGTENKWYEAVAGGGYVYKTIHNPSGGSIANGLSFGDFDIGGYTDVFRVRTNLNLDWYESDGSDSGLAWRKNMRNLGDSGPVVVGHFDGDGYDDMFFAVGSVMLWHETNGDNSEARVWHTNLMSSGWSSSDIKDMIIGDFDGDEEAMDLFIVRADGTVEWWENSADSEIDANDLVMTLTGLDALSVELGDVDSDGITELFVGRSGNGIMIYEPAGDDAINSGLDTQAGYNANDLAIYVPVDANGSSLGLGSIDNDGRGDLFSTTSVGRMVWRESINAPREVNDLKEVDSAPNSPSSMMADITVYELNGDGNEDLLYIKDGIVMWRSVTGADDGLTYYRKIQFNIPYKAVAAGDFDGDANGDLFLVSNTGHVLWYESDGEAVIHSVANMTDNATCVAVGNFDHYLGNDILVGKSGAGSGISWYESNGDDSYLWIDTVLSGFSIKKVAMGDLDGDDNTDLAVVRYDSGLNRNIVACYESITDDSFIWQLHGRGGITDVNAHDVSIGDIDGDGSGELVVVNENGGTLWYSYNTATDPPSLVNIGGSNLDPNALAVEIIPTGDISLKLPCLEIAASDINGDCEVDFEDLYLISEQWLEMN